MNLMQFLIFMQMWNINLPATTGVCLKQLRCLALYEFLPTDTVLSWFKRVLGIEDKSCTSEDDESCLVEVSAEDDMSDID